MTEEEIFEYLRKQEEALNKRPSFYVHYEVSSGKIINFRNYLDSTDPFPFVILEEKDLTEPLQKFNIANYRVVVEDGKSKIESCVPEDLSLTRIDDFIYELPKIKSKEDKKIEESFDLLIEQDNIKGEFRIKLSDENKLKYKNQSMGFYKISLYVTAPYDPNILYKTLNLTLDDLTNDTDYYIINFKDRANNDKTIDRFNGEDVTIFSIRYFQNYLHVDIRDDKISSS